MEVNQQGHLTIGGADAFLLAKEYGTPLMVMNENLIRENCRKLTGALKKYYGGNGLVCYASKAFCCKEIYRIMQDEKMGADVVSEGEIYTAIKAGFPPENLCFHGSNKTRHELDFAIENGVGRIVVDNVEELSLLEELCDKKNKEVSILLRIKPGVDAHTHDFIRTGQIDSKFGFAYETGEALEAACFAAKASHLKLAGAHCHIGSQIFEVEPYLLAAKVMMNFLKEVHEKTGQRLNELNMGGGFGISYQPEDKPLPFEAFIMPLAELLQKEAEKEDVKPPFLLLEPGRSIVGNAGITLYTVGSRKEIPGVRTYIGIDGGMTDNPRYALYGAKYEALLAENPKAEKSEIVTIAGKCCESGDLIAKDIKLQHAKAGDILAVLDTGAYNYSMASHYNRVGKPAVLMVKDGCERIILKRETLEDLIRNDV